MKRLLLRGLFQSLVHQFVFSLTSLDSTSFVFLSLEDGHNINQDGLMIKKSRMGNCKFTFLRAYSGVAMKTKSITPVQLDELYCICLISEILLGDLIDSVKIAAEGVKSHSSTVATWMRNNVSPTLRNILPASPGPPPLEDHPQPQASTSAMAWAGRAVRLITSTCVAFSFFFPLLIQFMYVFNFFAYRL